MTSTDTQQSSFSGLRPEDTASLIAAAADVALLIDANGVICDVSLGSEELADLVQRDWVGRSWTETVTVESRPKVEDLLRSGGKPTTPKWRHINYPSTQGGSVPVLYATVKAGGSGQIVAIGRDMRQFTAVQERLIAAQQSMQRDYARMRQMEMRYRALFDAVSEPVLIVDSSTLKIMEANPAAGWLFADSTKRLAGRPVLDCFDMGSRPTLLAMLETLRTAKQTDLFKLRPSKADSAEVDVSASVFRQDTGSLFLIQISRPAVAGEEAVTQAPRSKLLAAIEHAPDALVVTDQSGKILYTNPSFVLMAQMESTEQIVGESLDRWLGRSGVDLGVLMSNLRQNEMVRLFPTVIRGRFGGETTVEISAASAPDGKHPCLGFTIRDVGRRLSTEQGGRQGLTQSVGQLAELVGRAPLKDIVGKTTDLIEELCIQAALQLTRDNRAAAAEMLGLSRQSLYVKLRRYGIGEYPAADH